MNTDDELLLILVILAIVAIGSFIIVKLCQSWKAKKSKEASYKAPETASPKEKEPDKAPKSAPPKKEAPPAKPKRKVAEPVVLYQYEQGNHSRLCRCCMCENPLGAVRCEVCGEILS